MNQCKNCEKTLHEADKFCNDCGAQVINHRLSLKYLFKEISNGFLNIDASRPIRTFIDLFTKPEDVIVGYINGTRKKYINAFGYFTIAVTLAGIFMFVLSRFFPEILNQALDLFTSSSLITKEQMMDSDLNQGQVDYQSLIFFASIPFLALISRLLFWRNKRFNYAEHLVINLYAYSHVSIVMYIVVFPILIFFPYGYAIGSFGSIILYTIYYFYALKRIYSIEAGPMVLKTILFYGMILGFLIILIIVSAILGAILAASGML